MLVKEKLGNINFFAISNRKIDYLFIEWYEATKRILHKKTISGRDVAMKFLNENPQLSEGDVVYEDDFNIVVVEISPCDAIIVRPRTMFEMAAVSYEIGNKHIPVFYDQEELMVAFERPLYNSLLAAGYDVHQGSRKLVTPLKTSVAPHGKTQGDTLFSRIMKLTNPPG
ncbi:MAG: urease accessory protein UreE [Bacteroidota bacterium]